MQELIRSQAWRRLSPTMRVHRAAQRLRYPVFAEDDREIYQLQIAARDPSIPDGVRRTFGSAAEAALDRLAAHFTPARARGRSRLLDDDEARQIPPVVDALTDWYKTGSCSWQGRPQDARRRSAQQVWGHLRIVFTRAKSKGLDDLQKCLKGARRTAGPREQAKLALAKMLGVSVKYIEAAVSAWKTG